MATRWSIFPLTIAILDLSVKNLEDFSLASLGNGHENIVNFEPERVNLHPSTRQGYTERVVGHFQPPKWRLSSLSTPRYQTLVNTLCVNYKFCVSFCSSLRSTKWNLRYPKRRWLQSPKAPSKQSNFTNMLFSLSKSFCRKSVLTIKS